MTFFKHSHLGAYGYCASLCCRGACGRLGQHRFFPCRRPIGSCWYLWPCCFLVTVQPGSKKEGFLFDWLWGIVFFSVGLRWCYGSLHDHGQLSMMLSVTAIVSFGAVLACFIGCVTGITRVLPVSRRLKLIVLLPVLWSIFELLRVWSLQVSAGFPSVTLTHRIFSGPGRRLRVSTVWASQLF